MLLFKKRILRHDKIVWGGGDAFARGGKEGAESVRGPYFENTEHIEVKLGRIAKNNKLIDLMLLN